MKHYLYKLIVGLHFLCMFLLIGNNCVIGDERNLSKDEWIDETGHKVIRLTRNEGSNWGFYFHDDPFTATGDKMVFFGSTDKGVCAFTVNMKTLEIQQITNGQPLSLPIVAPKRRELFYISNDTVYATHLDSLTTRVVTKNVPPYYTYGRGFTVNADETLLLGCYAKGEIDYYAKYNKPLRDEHNKGTHVEYEWFVKIFEANLPNALYTISTTTGEVNEFYHLNRWLGHPQFSPTDPSLVMFCHEGPSDRLDRIWFIRTDDSGLRQLRKKTVSSEVMTHEFWSTDGAHIWYDNRTSSLFLAGVDAKTGDLIAHYPITPEQSCWHYNISNNGKIFCGDGGDSEGKAQKWLYLFIPDGDKLQVEHLCNLEKHSYRIAPNAKFTPDDKWVVFCSDMFGTSQMYAVEVQKSK